MPDFPRLVELASLALGVAYVLLAIRRRRSCWIYGGLSSVGMGWLAWRTQLPQHAALQVYYVGLSAYGFWRWSRETDEQGVRVGWWPLWKHAVVAVIVLAVAALTARWVVATVGSAAPYLEAVTTWGSLVAAWLAARARVENWLWWIVIDTGLAVLFAMQGLYGAALLFVAYLVFAVVGFRSWVRRAPRWSTR